MNPETPFEISVGYQQRKQPENMFVKSKLDPLAQINDEHRNTYDINEINTYMYKIMTRKEKL